MRVAIITDLPFLYNDTMYLSEVEKRIRDFGTEVNIFVVRGSEMLARVDITTGIIRMTNAAMLLFQLSDYDIIHIQFTYPIGFIFALLKSLRMLRVPLIVHTHGYDVFSVPEIDYGLRRNRLGKRITESVWKRASEIIVVCEKARNEILRTGIHTSKIKMLYNGVDEKLFSKTTQIDQQLEDIRKENDFIFISIASLVPVKNHARLMQAFNILTQKYGTAYKMKLLLIGERRSDIRILDEKNVLYMGRHPHKELPKFYSIADAFALPSLSEAHPWALLEAMSCELPVIASNVGGIPETIANSDFLVNPYDINDITEKFESMLLMDGKQRRAIGLQNRQKILESFTIDRHVQRLREIYESAVLTDCNVNPTS